MKLRDFSVGDKVVVVANSLTGEVVFVGSGPKLNKVTVQLNHPVHREFGPAIMSPGELRITEKKELNSTCAKTKRLSSKHPNQSKQPRS